MPAAAAGCRHRPVGHIPANSPTLPLDLGLAEGLDLAPGRPGWTLGRRRLRLGPCNETSGFAAVRSERDRFPASRAPGRRCPRDHGFDARPRDGGCLQRFGDIPLDEAGSPSGLESRSGSAAISGPKLPWRSPGQSAYRSIVSRLGQSMQYAPVLSTESGGGSVSDSPGFCPRAAANLGPGRNRVLYGRGVRGFSDDSRRGDGSGAGQLRKSQDDLTGSRDCCE